MGCHTWFSRPITEEEFEWLREYACEDVYNLYGPTEENIFYGFYNAEALSKFNLSFKDDSPSYFGVVWWEVGFGASNPKFIERDGCKPSIRSINIKKSKKSKSKTNNLYIDLALNIDSIEKKFHMTYQDMVENKLYESLYFPYFHDEFRIYNYPRKVIHNRRQLRRYLGKRYFELTEFQKERISMFFKLYPGGVISFG